MAASSFVKRPPLPKPALLTSTSTVSPRCSISPISFLRLRSFDTSPVTTSASTPWSSVISSASSRRRSSRRATSVTDSPRAASPRAISAPMPELAPVISAVVPGSGGGSAIRCPRRRGAGRGARRAGADAAARTRPPGRPRSATVDMLERTSSVEGAGVDQLGVPLDRGADRLVDRPRLVAELALGLLGGEAPVLGHQPEALGRAARTAASSPRGSAPRARSPAAARAPGGGRRRRRRRARSARASSCSRRRGCSAPRRTPLSAASRWPWAASATSAKFIGASITPGSRRRR